MPMGRLKVRVNEAQSRKPVPDDTYPATITDLQDEREGPNASYVPVEFTISEGPHAGRKFYSNFMTSGKAAGMFVELINKVLGTSYDVDEMRASGQEELDVDPNDMIGASVAVVMKQEEYPEGSGEYKSQIKSVLAAGSRAGKPTTDSETSRKRRS